uniref:Uncharacterized protein n=1 Tax=Oryza nivara TaxID=4536 RepID=A0A0E0GPH3_ORYNI
MTKLEIDPTNILPISLEDLYEEQRREIEQHLKATQEALLAGCFINTRQGVVGKPGSTPKVTVMSKLEHTMTSYFDKRIVSFMNSKFGSHVINLPSTSVASTSQAPIHHILAKSMGDHATCRE